ncbi:hypothetical protein Q3G72_001342 [Acer saccharum]|nr:hypothetical protein Q3G72_001342 [Acer saccharum]
MALVPSEGDSGPEESDEDDHKFEAPGLFSNQGETELSWASLEQKGEVEELKKDPALDDQRSHRRHTDVARVETRR